MFKLIFSPPIHSPLCFPEMSMASDASPFQPSASSLQPPGPLPPAVPTLPCSSPPPTTAPTSHYICCGPANCLSKHITRENKQDGISIFGRFCLDRPSQGLLHLINDPSPTRGQEDPGEPPHQLSGPWWFRTLLTTDFSCLAEPPCLH